MRRGQKKIKKQKPQLIRIIKRDKEELEQYINIFNNKTIRGFDGSDRNWQTSLLNEQVNRIQPSIIQNSIFKCNINRSNKEIKNKFINKFNQLDKKRSISRNKNFCLFIGSDRTYIRNLFITRHIFRNMMNINTLVGVKKF